MDYIALRVLSDTHPNPGGTNAEDMLIWVNDPTGVSRSKPFMTPKEIKEIVLANPSDYKAMSAPERDALNLVLVTQTDINTQNGTPDREMLEDILGATTLAALSEALPEQVSRAVDAGLGIPNLGDVQNARAL